MRAILKLAVRLPTYKGRGLYTTIMDSLFLCKIVFEFIVSYFLIYSRLKCLTWGDESGHEFGHFFSKLGVCSGIKIRCHISDRIN